MLRVHCVDRVIVSKSMAPAHYGWMHGQFSDLAEYEKVPLKKVSPKPNDPSYGVTMQFSSAGKKVRVSMLKAYDLVRVEYDFNGIADIEEYESRTALLTDWSFREALLHGRVKRFELAIDLPGLKSTNFICHLKGSKFSNVQSNKEKNGFSHYSGKYDSRSQLVMYDKAQEIRDKGGDSYAEDILRVEYRILKSPTSFSQGLDIHALQEKMASSIYVIEIDKALAIKNAIPAWPIFLSTCKQEGTAYALRQFPHHAKTFLARLKALSEPKYTPVADSLMYWLDWYKSAGSTS